MANRYRKNFLYGVVSGYNATQVTFTGTGFNNIGTIPAGYYLPIILNPGYQGGTASGEVVYVLSATSTTITVSGSGGNRLAFDGTTTATGVTGAAWVSGPLASDFTSSSGIANIVNGDWPAPSASGQLFVSTSTTSGQFQTTLPTGITVPTSQLTGNLNATTITGTLNATTVTGVLTSATISGINVVGNPAVNVYSNALGSLTQNGVYTKIVNFNTPVAKGGFTTSSTSVTVPIAGVYQVTGQITFSGASIASTVIFGTMVSGTTAGIIFDSKSTLTANTTNNPAINSSTIITLASGETVSLYGFNSSSSSATYVPGTAYTYLALTLVSQ